MGQTPVRLLTPVEIYVIVPSPGLAKEVLEMGEWLVAGVVARRARRQSFVVGRDSRF
jgi:hypothetical protein